MPGFRRRVTSRAGSWLHGAYRLCFIALIGDFVQSIDHVWRHECTYKDAVSALVWILTSAALCLLLLEVGRRRGETYTGDSSTLTQTGIWVVAGVVVGLCLPVLRGI